MSLWSKLSKFLTAKQRKRVLAVGQTMADKNGVVFMTDVVLTTFLRGLDVLEAENAGMKRSNGAAICWYCGGPLVWQSDFNYDEVHGEGEGIVSYLHCSDCGAMVEFSLRDDEEEVQD